MANSELQRKGPGFRSAGVAVIAGLIFCASPPAIAQADPRFAELDQLIRSDELGPITSLLIWHDDALLFEAYYRGTHAGRLHDLFSATKSVGATLIGIAEQRGLLSTEATLSELLPAYAWNEPPFSMHTALRLEHVLSMRHGIAWDELTHPIWDLRNSYQQMLRAPDWYRFVLSQPRAAPPDSHFVYNSGVSNLMGDVLREATTMPSQQLFEEWIAQPLGIGHFDWEVQLWRDGSEAYTRQFPFGEAPLGVGLKLRTRDLLRIGILYRNRGMHDGQRLLDAHWIDRAWTAHSNGDNDPGFRLAPERNGYGYQWWFNEFLDARSRRIGCWYAAGAGRQYLFVCPSLDLVVATNSVLSDYDGPGIGSGMREHILPAFEIQERGPAQFSGLWYDPSTSGQGFNLQNSPNGWFGFYYGYDEGKPLWLLFDPLPAEPQFGETLELDAWMPVQGVFGAPVRPRDGGIAPWGKLHLRFDSCTRAHAHLQGLSGEQAFDLVLLAGIDGVDRENCTAPPAQRALTGASGAWYDPETSGQGWNFVHTPNGLAGYFYGYDQHGDPLWLTTGNIQTPVPGEMLHFELLAGSGGSFETPVPPSELEHWGFLELTLDDCRQAQAVLKGRDGEQIQALTMLAVIPGLPECTEPES